MGARRIVPAAVGVLVAMVAIGGCSGGPGRPTSSVSQPTSEASASTPGNLSTAGILVVPASLIGTYEASVVGTTASSGIWKLEIKPWDLLLTNPVGGDAFSIDPVTVDATQMTLRSSSDCEDQTDGQYTISLKGTQLTFTAIRDGCGDRKATLTTTPWTRRP
jgi:hypothetical protein